MPSAHSGHYARWSAFIRVLVAPLFNGLFSRQDRPRARARHLSLFRLRGVNGPDPLILACCHFDVVSDASIFHGESLPTTSISVCISRGGGGGQFHAQVSRSSLPRHPTLAGGTRYGGVLVIEGDEGFKSNNHREGSRL
jgi:hypothetical protein